jgi:hypothetical protein
VSTRQQQQWAAAGNVQFVVHYCQCGEQLMRLE